METNNKATLHYVNPTDSDWTKHRYILAFGAYGSTYIMACANSLDDALDQAVDYIADHFPGLLCDDQVNEAYEAAIAEGLGEDEAVERSLEDVTTAGNAGHHILSYEWSIVCEDPTRDQIKEYDVITAA